MSPIGPSLDCRAARLAWHDRCDGALELARGTRLEAHLQNCADCRRFVEQMSAIDAGLAALRTDSASAARARFPAAATPQVLSPSRRPMRLQTYPRAAGFAVAAALLVAVGAGFLVSRSVIRPGRALVSRPQPSIRHDNAAMPTLAIAQVSLVGASADNFLLVAEKTRDTRVHIFRLHAVYQVPADGAAVQAAVALAGTGPVVSGS